MLFFFHEDSECLIKNTWNKKKDRKLPKMWETPYECDHDKNHLQELPNFKIKEQTVLQTAGIPISSPTHYKLYTLSKLPLITSTPTHFTSLFNQTKPLNQYNHFAIILFTLTTLALDYRLFRVNAVFKTTIYVGLGFICFLNVVSFSIIYGFYVTFEISELVPLFDIKDVLIY